MTPRAYGPHDESKLPQVHEVTLGSLRPRGPGGPYRKLEVPIPDAIKRQRAQLNGRAYTLGRRAQEGRP